MIKPGAVRSGFENEIRYNALTFVTGYIMWQLQQKFIYCP